jgi:F-type H+-transporting ATPase subunit delta
MIDTKDYSAIADAYAGAVFSVALEQKTIDNVGTELDALLVLARQEKELFDFLDSPYYSIENKKSFVQRVFAGRFSQLTTNFLLVIIKNSRARYLPYIISRYSQLWFDNYDICPVVVTVSEQISDERKRSIHQRISDAIRRNVELKVHIDPSIIGGIIIRYGDNLIDNSVRKRLNGAVETVIHNCSQRGRIDEI